MSPTVLLVDDEPHVLSSLRRGLHEEPFEILCAHSAQEALVFLQAKPVDVVVSDQDMPGTPGTVFLAEVHKAYPDTIRFMLTGKATLDVAIEAVNSGAISRFLTKPCIVSDLAATIRQALQHKELMLAANHLLQTVKTQSSELARLEAQYPGITNVHTDSDGVIIAEHDDMSLDELLLKLRHKTSRSGTS
jgi:two-component system, probable response regulator PhcQ